MSYVLITPARNEAAFIEGTIKSVIAQTILPLKWVIVSDGSTDGTDEIVRKYIPDNPWIELIRMPESRDRTFAAKVACVNAGYERVKEIPYDIIGMLDADITFGPDYFEYLLSQFKDNPKLGVAGTPFVEDGVQYDYKFSNIEHVSGACQLFRRECYEDIGGYIPIKGGGIDVVAVTNRADERLADPHLHGEDLFPSPQDGHGVIEQSQRPVQTRQGGLLPRRPSPLAGRPVSVPAHP